jgi:hypothetical protein
MKIINENGKLICPLFHGTSTLFLDSIINNGLAGDSPLQGWKVFEFAKELEILCKNHMSDNYCYLRAGAAWQGMLEQRADDKLNFQHGETYLTSCMKIAVNYSISSKYGSEFLSYAMKITDELRREFVLKKDNQGIEELEILLKRYKHITKLDKQQQQCSHPILSPILIKMFNVPIDFLKGEDGGGPEKALKELNEDYEENIQTANFRLISPLHKKNLEVFLIHVNSIGNYLDYDLYPLNICSIAK